MRGVKAGVERRWELLGFGLSSRDQSHSQKVNGSSYVVKSLGKVTMRCEMR